MRLVRTLCLIAAVSAPAASAGSASAQDFFSAFFGGFGGHPTHQSVTPSDAMPYAPETYYERRVAPRRVQAPSAPRASSDGSAGAQAFCVRTCDGRYFPVNGDDSKSRAATCNSLCPASETAVMTGSSIEKAETANGKNYTDLPNAFRYRKEIVDGCTCNGKDAFGLAKIDPDKDPTVRKGDIVAAENGLMVASRSADRRHGAANFSPASESIRAKYERLPVVASE